MGKIIGESFDPYVDEQVKIRQQKLGQTNRDNDLLTYITSKTSWIRLASSVDINQEKANELGTNQNGSLLAKNNVLQGGNSRSTGNKLPRAGIIDAYGEDPTQAYGFNSTAEFGLIPPPSVESFEITPKNNGSLSVAEVKLKCFSKQQFKIIETLYLRIGYHLLLEWGHSLYYNNKGDLISNPIFSIPSTALFSGGAAGVKDVLKTIKETREESNGNYDGLVGRVTNFNWNVTPDGHYDIKISITSTGDVIESLAISTPLPSKGEEDSTKVGSDEEDKEKRTSSAIDKTPLGRILKYLKMALNWPNIIGPLYLKEFGSKEKYGLSTTTVKYVKPLTNDRVLNLVGFNDVTPHTEEPTGTINTKKPEAENEIVYINGEGTSSDYDYYYLKFGALLRIIQNFLLIYNKAPGDNTPLEPLFRIDYDYDDNKAYLPADVFSIDPRICIIPSRVTGTYRGFWTDYISQTQTFKELNKLLGTDFFDPNNEFICNFMHIHLNIGFIKQCLIDSLNNEGDIKFLDFLSKICEGINSKLCNYVQFEPFHDKDTNTLHIVNKANSDKLLENSPPVTRFRVGLLPQGESSFVKDVSIESTIPANFATQIAIGAQANNNEGIYNSSPFSRWNAGLEDRIFKEKKTAANSSVDEDKKAQTEKEEEEKFKELVEALGETIYYYNDFDLDEDLWDLEIAVKDYFKIQLQKLETQEQASSPMIIPISLSLTMDGISGIKIFQKYTITEDFLPDSYQNSVEFIVKGVTHTIDNGGWVTKIEGQCIPKVNYALVDSLPNRSKITAGATAGASVGTAFAQFSSSTTNGTAVQQFSGSTPNANALRLVLNKLGYKEKGEEISNGGDISMELANYAIAVFTEIKTQYPNIDVRITGGNDKYHQKLSYNSAHKRGDGLDFVISPSDPTTLANIDLLLQGFAAGNRNPAVSFINEYDSPTKAASAKHFHIRMGRDKSGYNKIQNAYALADKGQLITYNIA